MIASPGDVSQERRIIRDVIEEWNTIHAEDRHIGANACWLGDSFFTRNG